ncbi:hypothetical protein J4731_02830 [Providencia rettgeri]|nr:hypothetical protein [Providencia rettgeri]
MTVIFISVIVLILAGYAIAKNYEAKIVLFTAGIALMLSAAMLGMPILDIKQSTGNIWLDPLKQIQLGFIKQFGGRDHNHGPIWFFFLYVTHWCKRCSRSFSRKTYFKIRSPYILVPIVFWLGNLLSLVIPSAASLAVILMATLYPILRAAKMSSMTAAGIIATTATLCQHH